MSVELAKTRCKMLYPYAFFLRTDLWSLSSRVKATFPLESRNEPHTKSRLSFINNTECDSSYKKQRCMRVRVLNCGLIIQSSNPDISHQWKTFHKSSRRYTTLFGVNRKYRLCDYTVTDSSDPYLNL